jgi:outer membrane protein OmpA-like peptidoglycan-associated protein
MLRAPTPRPLVATVALLTLVGCAQGQPGQPGTGTGVGAATGAVVGGVLGNVLSAEGRRSENTAIGAAVGAALGGGVGYAMDRQRQDFERELAAERARNDVQIEQLRQDVLLLTLDEDVQFAVDSAIVQPGFRTTLSKVADVLRRYPATEVTIIGHTDSTGAADYNQALSERRAEAVRSELVAMGVSGGRLRTAGRGETEPRASNETATGRAANRRVELVLTEPA